MRELCTLKLDEEKSKHTGLTQQKTFGPAFLHCCLRQVKGTAECTCEREESHKYDLIATPCFDRPIIMIGLGDLLLLVSHLFAVPLLVLWVGLQKRT